MWQIVFSLFFNFFEDFESQFNLISQIQTLLKKSWITKDLGKVKTNSFIKLLSRILKLWFSKFLQPFYLGLIKSCLQGITFFTSKTEPFAATELLH